MEMIENILSRLEKVKGRNGAYTACCPAHSDKSPSLAIRELDDGRILMKCFGGCSVQEIMGAIEMEMEDLFQIQIKTCLQLRESIMLQTCSESLNSRHG